MDELVQKVKQNLTDEVKTPAAPPKLARLRKLTVDEEVGGDYFVYVCRTPLGDDKRKS